jgi:hypothetical protein
MCDGLGNIHGFHLHPVKMVGLWVLMSPPPRWRGQRSVWGTVDRHDSPVAELS